MLPFLKHKKSSTGIAMAIQKKDGSIEPELETVGEEMSLLESCQAMIDAIHAKDAEKLAMAFEEAFEALESKPHEEAESEEEIE